MKIFFTIIFIAISITSLLSACQNNLDQSTKTILDNAASLKKKIQEISYENISSEQIVLLLLMQNIQEKADLVSNITKIKNSYGQLEIILDWFEKEKNIDNWTDYFAIHNQTINGIKNYLSTLQDNPKLDEYGKEFSEKIITIFTNVIITFNEDPSISKNDILSLIYVYQDYVKLFENYIKIDNEKIRSILMELK